MTNDMHVNLMRNEDQPTRELGNSSFALSCLPSVFSRFFDAAVWNRGSVDSGFMIERMISHESPSSLVFLTKIFSVSENWCSNRRLLGGIRSTHALWNALRTCVSFRSRHLDSCTAYQLAPDFRMCAT